MKKKLTYTNRKGNAYFFREVTGKRGTRIACSQKESVNDLTELPETHEIAETPNGQVSCRKKLVSEIFPEELALARKICAKRVKKGVRVAVELKKKAIIIHSADSSGEKKLAEMMRQFNPVNLSHLDSFLEARLYFEAVLKLELTDKADRIFSIERMCWTGGCDWLFLEEGSLPKLLKKYVPHIEQESFFELI